MTIDEIIELAKKDPLKLKIKDIVQWTFEKPVNEIAKEYLPMGEKKVREILIEVGCVSNKGKKGWTYEPNNLEVEKELGEFVKVKAKSNNNASTSTSKDNSTKTIKSNTDNKNNIANENKDEINRGDSIVAEIKSLITDKKKDGNTRVYKGVYFDKDIADFLDNIKHGNRSELINKILRLYLTENDLL